jgi:hypothetical protein
LEILPRFLPRFFCPGVGFVERVVGVAHFKNSTWMLLALILYLIVYLAWPKVR